MKENDASEKTITIRCPECFNYMKSSMKEQRSYFGVCNVCRTAVFTKMKTSRETCIRIVRNTAN